MKIGISADGLILRKLDIKDRNRCGCDYCEDAYSYEDISDRHYYGRKIVKSTAANEQFGKFCLHNICPYYGEKGGFTDERAEADGI